MTLAQRAACIVALLICFSSTAGAQNVLSNPGFESGLTGWVPFGNAYAEAANPPVFVPLSGNGLVSMFGNFYGGFNVTGIFQEFPAVVGSTWQMSSNARHYSGDTMVGGGAPTSNWVVQKIAFFDAGGAEIGSVESTILDGTFAPDVWHASGPIVGVAPIGTVKFQALILYLQPAFDGGACHVDDIDVHDLSVVGTDDASWSRIKSRFDR